jgi:hypothetical protein
MHDLDRSMFEVGGELASHELAAHGEMHELEHEDFLGVLGSLLGGEVGELQETGGPGELQEIELASELLEVGSEAELDRFIGDLMRRATWPSNAPCSRPTRASMSCSCVSKARWAAGSAAWSPVGGRNPARSRISSRPANSALTAGIRHTASWVNSDARRS